MSNAAYPGVCKEAVSTNVKLCSESGRGDSRFKSYEVLRSKAQREYLKYFSAAEDFETHSILFFCQNIQKVSISAKTEFE